MAASLLEKNPSTFNESIVPAAKEEHANLGKKLYVPGSDLKAVSYRLIVARMMFDFIFLLPVRVNNSSLSDPKQAHSKKAFISNAKTWKHTQCRNVHNGCA